MEEQPKESKRTRTTTMNPKQLIFINEYIKTNNARQAAITAGYSPKSAHSIAYDNLHRPYIIKYINDLKQQITNETILSILERKQLLSELARKKGKETIQAIGELNRMEQVYATAPQTSIPININYVLATKENAQQLAEGIRKRQLEDDTPIDEVETPTLPQQQNMTPRLRSDDTPITEHDTPIDDTK